MRLNAFLLLFSFVLSTFILLMCTDDSNHVLRSSEFRSMEKNNGIIVLTSSTELYNTGDYPLWENENSGWITYQPGTGDYTLGFELLRDIIVGRSYTPMSVTSIDDSVRVIVQDRFNSTILDTWYHLEDIAEWYTYNPCLDGGTASHRFKILVPDGFYQACRAVVTLTTNQCQ